MPALTRSDIEAWDTTHLEAAATHWRSTAAHWEGHFETIHTGMLRPGGTAWEGTAADAAAEHSWGDLVKVRGAGDALYTAAGHATNGAGDIAWAKRQVLDIITEAEEAGFTVGQDFSLTDTSSWGGMLRTTVARQQQQQAFATEISTRVQALVAIDKQVASQITAALAPLETLQFDETPDQHTPTVQAMGFHHFKQDGHAPPPPPPPGPSSSDIRSVLDQLPKGSRNIIREVKSPEDLERLREWMTEHGTDMQSRYPDPNMGEWKRLPDGSEVGLRKAAKSTGENSLDIDLNKPDGTSEHWKVHINRERGGEPNIPETEAPRVESNESPKASEAEPGEASVSEAGPGESGGGLAPAESGAGGWGGPSAEPFGPQPVHPPGSIHHSLPVLGEDDPAENPRDFEGH